MSLIPLNGSTLIRLGLLGLLLVGVTLGSWSLCRIPGITGWRAPSATTGSARPVREREVDEWLPVSLSCRRIERFGS